MKKESTLRTILNDVFTSKTREEALCIINTFLDTNPKGIGKSNTYKMRIKAAQCSSLISVQTYVSNAFLKFEGLGL